MAVTFRNSPKDHFNDNIDMELTTLTEDSFKELMRLATSGVEFSFNDKIYRQTDGVAMGSPLGPVLANIFVVFYEKKKAEEEYPSMYFRFVDDVFSYFANQSRSVEFFERLNGLHEALRFTQEGERECSLPFLDVKVSRTDESIITSMYRKPTFTGRYTPWDSISATSYEINLVRSLTNRVFRICSPSACHRRGVEDPVDHSVKNGYPGYRACLKVSGNEVINRARGSLGANFCAIRSMAKAMIAGPRGRLSDSFLYSAPLIFLTTGNQNCFVEGLAIINSYNIAPMTFVPLKHR